MAKLEKMTDPILTSSHFQPRMTLTISSILRILLTVSEARVMELVDTRLIRSIYSEQANAKNIYKMENIIALLFRSH